MDHTSNGGYENMVTSLGEKRESVKANANVRQVD